MRYYANPSTEPIRELMRRRVLGFIDTPRQRNIRPPEVLWCADNGCFGKGWPGYEKWVGWLSRNAEHAATCAFATAPDVVADAAATWERSRPWLPRIRALGYPAAYVGQDGLTVAGCPWDEFDVLFIGGSTEWKLGKIAADLVAEAKARSKPVHMGRVNSGERFRYAAMIGCDSADGTTLARFPDATLPSVLKWLADNDASLAYWSNA